MRPGELTVIASSASAGKSLIALIGKAIYIEWNEPEADWNWFKLLAYHDDEVWLKGMDEPFGSLHKGDTVVVKLSEIKRFEDAEKERFAPKVPTGWIRYRITDKSGSGSKDDHWVFCPSVAESEDSDVRDHILHSYETWAIHAERYHLEFFRNEVPPAPTIRRQLNLINRQLSAANENLQLLNEQLVARKIARALARGG